MSRAGTVGFPYTLPVGVSAGSSAVTWSITAGSLPPGLALDTTTGAVRGTPTAAGTTTFDITATTAAGRDTESTAIIVLPAPPSSGARPGLPPQQLSTGSPLVVGLGARTFALNAVATGAGSTTGQGVAGGRLSYSSASPAVCSVDASGVVTALKAGTCSVSITAAATSTHSAAVKTLDVTITDARTSVVALPAGPQRFAGADRVATSADIASEVFATPSTGTSRDVVIATAASYADALPGARLAGQVGGPLLLTDAGRLSEQAAAQVERLVAAGGTVYVLGGDRALSAAVQQATDGLVAGDSVVRLSGGDRFETAVAVADATTRRAGDVGPIYLVTGRDFADGVSVAAYAQSTGGVVLLTDGGTMPAVTAAYLAAHDPTGTRAIAIGGPARAAAASAGLVGAVERAVVGADRFETSAQLSAAMRAAAPGIPSTATSTATSTVATVGLAGGTSWPDALSGSAAMAALGGPLLLTATGVDAVPTSTASALGRLQAERVLVFGGASAVTEGAYGRAGALLSR
nr:cell wall-binding repeat-containing protein [Quadrisphaera sp. RL12-1S]